MTPQQTPPDLFVAERPVRSDFARAARVKERVYARRRRMTLAVIAAIVLGVIYAIVAHRPRDPADIPTLHAEGPYRQKPADPGGIDIPHQDVQVYDRLESDKQAVAAVEHLLPPPETPKDKPKEAAHEAAKDLPPPDSIAPPPVAAPPPVVVMEKHAAPAAEAIDPIATPKPITTTVSPAVVPAKPVAVLPAPTPAPASEATAPKTIEQVIANTVKASPPPSAPSPAPSPSSGASVVQLASSPDQAKAQAMRDELQRKFAADLGGATLRLEKADLGSRGVFYRIQSQPLSEAEANRICSGLKQKKAGCILVRK